MGDQRPAWALRGDGRSILLDRREFLKLTAASGMVAAGSAWLVPGAVAQEPSPSAGPDSDPVAAMAAALGHDRERIFRLVADQIRYEPYAGMLRGARGTLQARAGSSVDQAVLLAELLRAGGAAVRFVSGPLDPAAAQELMAATVTDAAQARRHIDEALVSEDDLATGIDWSVPGSPIPADRLAEFPDLATVQATFAADAETLGDFATRRTQGTVAMLVEALAGAGIEVGRPATTMPTLEQTSHAWVQVSDGTSWLDLDPTFATAQAGEAFAVPSATAEEVPDQLRHRLDFTVIAETWLGGALVKDRLLSVTGFADQLAYSGLLFTHLPAESLSGLDLIGALGAGTGYNPVLAVGPDVYVGKQSLSIGGMGGDPFGDALGGGGGGLVDGETSAEWLEVGIVSPGAEPAVARRAIFDRIGQPGREAGTIDPYAVPAAEFVDLGDGAGAQFLPCRSLRAFLVSGGPTNLKGLLEGVGIQSIAAPALLPGSVAALGDLLGVAMAPALGCRPFREIPGVLAWVLEATPEGYADGLDIWHRGFGSLPLAGMEPSAPQAMIAGVIHAVVEAVALGAGSPAADGVPGPLTVDAVFETAVAAGISIRAFQGALPASVGYSPEHRRWLEAALEAGLVVVVPERQMVFAGRPRLAWWLIDPLTGAAVDQLDDGTGGGNTENTVVLSPGMVQAYQALVAGMGVFTTAIHRSNLHNTPGATQLLARLGEEITILRILMGLGP